MAMQGVDSEWMDQCQYGQQGGTEQPVKKPTRWMSNSPGTFDVLKLKCNGKAGGCTRVGGVDHRLCIGDVARMAAIYPMNLCKAIIQGCRAQLREDGRVVIGHVGILPRECGSWSDKKLEGKAEKLLHVKITQNDKEFTDSVTGQPLDADLVREARRK